MVSRVPVPVVVVTPETQQAHKRAGSSSKDAGQGSPGTAASSANFDPDAIELLGVPDVVKGKSPGKRAEGSDSSQKRDAPSAHLQWQTTPPSPAWLNQTAFQKQLQPRSPLGQAAPSVASTTRGKKPKWWRFSTLTFERWPPTSAAFPNFQFGNNRSEESTTDDEGKGKGVDPKGAQVAHYPAPTIGEKAPSATYYGDLFFDLLFAANLDVFTEAAMLDNTQEVAGFLGWFAILWWAWFSHVLFDVRYRHLKGQGDQAANVTEHLRYTANHADGSRSIVPLLAAQMVLRLIQIGLWVCFMTTASIFERGNFDHFSFVYFLNRLSLAGDWAAVLLWKAWCVWQTNREKARELAEAASKKPTDPADAETGSRQGRSSPTVRSDSGASSDTVVSLSEQSQGSLDGTSLAHGITTRGEIASFVGLLVSSILWYASSRLGSAQSGKHIAIWSSAIACELAVLIWIEGTEAHGAHHLGHTPICERLTLFALVILGQGFVCMGSLLNSLSPGLMTQSEQDPSVMIPQGGWDAVVVVNLCAAVLIICCGFATYYRDAQTEMHRKNVRSLTILGWTAVHLIYFASAGLLVVGLKRLLALQSIVSAFTRFVLFPRRYLPNTDEWRNVTTQWMQTIIGEYAKIDPSDHEHTLLNMDLNTPEAGVLSVISVIEGFQGASIPSVDLARALVRSAIALKQSLDHGHESTTLDPALRIQMHHYYEFLHSVHEARSIRTIILQGLFQFKYVYLAVAAIYGCDVIIKGVLHGWQEVKKDKWPTLVIRIGMFCILCSVQAVYLHFKTLPSWIALAGGLPILAALMVIEILLQGAVEWVRGSLAAKRSRRS